MVAPVAPASFAFTTAAVALVPALSANHAPNSFGGFAPGANVGADALPQHGEQIDGSPHASAAAQASRVSAFTPADLPSLANSPASLDGPVTNGHVGAGGATAAQVQQALDESGLSVNGTGIKVGVLSDSFNDLGGAAADEADGALPPASDIQVLKDLASGGTDEGRAMMQIIHDIAPGASLAFYTAFDSEQDFANGILALAAAGCKVIVDDVELFRRAVLPERRGRAGDSNRGGGRRHLRHGGRQRRQQRLSGRLDADIGIITTEPTSRTPRASAAAWSRP